jgi:hypothetical protein
MKFINISTLNIFHERYGAGTDRFEIDERRTLGKPPSFHLLGGYGP